MKTYSEFLKKNLRSEDLSKEEKARRKAEKDAAWEEELAAWESTPPELR